MKLPLVDEIREARRLAEESHLASMHVLRIESALTSIGVTEQQVRLRPDLPARVPGDEVIELLAEHWAQLSDLGSSAIRTTEPVLHQFAVRRAQLDLARQVLRPIANEGTDRGRRLHELQHAQRHALEDAEWSDDVAELSDYGLERDRLAVEMTPLDARLAMVDPARAMLDTFVATLRVERDQPSDPAGHRAWRAAHLARTFVDSFQNVLRHLQLEVSVPDPPPVPAAPSADPAAQSLLWADVDQVRRLLGELGGILAREGQALRAERDAKKLRHEALTRIIVERMG